MLHVKPCLYSVLMAVLAMQQLLGCFMGHVLWDVINGNCGVILNGEFEVHWIWCMSCSGLCTVGKEWFSLWGIKYEKLLYLTSAWHFVSNNCSQVKLHTKPFFCPDAAYRSKLQGNINDKLRNTVSFIYLHHLNRGVFILHTVLISVAVKMLQIKQMCGYLSCLFPGLCASQSPVCGPR